MTFTSTFKTVSAMACAFAALTVAPVVQAKDQYNFNFNSAQGQTVSWNKGVQYVDGITPETVVRVINSKDQLPDNQTTFRVIVLNTSEASIFVSPENIWIEDADGGRFTMLSAEELEGRHRRDVKRRQALAVFAGAMAAGSANGQTSGSFNYSGTTSNGTSFSGFGTYSAYDPVLAMHEQIAAAEQSQATFNAIQVRQLAGIEALNGMLRQTTLQPGEVTSGILAFDPPRKLRKAMGRGPVTIVVKVGLSEHRFAAKLAELP
ncbi:hypothetical protein [Erythrobacter sanguineus]|uniref:Uncharacterized protein n=1 Tax=Erythrobacter sanguineus TaxID=198312 RepID=A0A1M7RY22_9SPHN|nr:hypothetical protein [Erythrobacter sanguineus]SHN51044.1 hypothetical protein SAMN02745193_00589 [Erythrobacter sanguineus]